ncbi:MAG: N-formylglutamate amidohydrolase [Rhodospirillaceae bacterium]|jgi:predicted N-formylglutamate amidohydrolase|nr:N-formylglutamate amidohydrolase [Rhodospirillaceae bacterium]MBT4044517.1 N-formylglutamate amidohydrolase [Rhodospirillaceae bacterium]MBT4688602.1 N-formylglutamate amidohydrolase [Rhodospirillaceae bacterium]MBT5079097.1 N-formylglutamate amidohydrolase [Rhodospirillaceae bacterium]MBT5526190.1 N-formylglutamate amidohydrolase [Rhodospirillaceae bacterium]
MNLSSDMERITIPHNPFTVVNGTGQADVVIICDHASAHVPQRFDGLGLPKQQLSRHIAWDIGAGDVARHLAPLLDAPAVLCGTSRLVIDCNRPFAVDSSIPEYSDGVEIPANANLDQLERTRRIDDYFHPYHNEISGRIDAHQIQGRAPALVSIHSFTPVMDGFQRPWHVGMLWDQDHRLATPVVRELRRDPELVVGENEPYDGSNPPGYALQAHAAENDLPIAVFEIRQDLIATEPDAERWAHILAKALRPALAAYGEHEISS